MNTKKKRAGFNQGKVIYLPPRLRTPSQPVQIGQIIVDGFHRYLEKMDADTFMKRFGVQADPLIEDAQMRYGGGELVDLVFFERKVWDVLPPQIANMESQEGSFPDKVRTLVREIAHKLNEYFITYHQWDH